MASVLVTFRIMPESIDIPLPAIEMQARKKIIAFGGTVVRTEEDPIAFGLVALKIIFSMDEAKGSTEALEDQLKEIDGIMNVEVTDVRRAFG